MCARQQYQQVKSLSKTSTFAESHFSSFYSSSPISTDMGMITKVNEKLRSFFKSKYILGLLAITFVYFQLKSFGISLIQKFQKVEMAAKPKIERDE